MRKLVAGLLGGIVFFAWGAIAHMFLGLGDMGVHYGTPYTATLSALKLEAPEGGLVMMPTTSRANMMDEAAAKQLQAESAGQGSAFIVYSPGGNPGSVDMGPNLAKQFATDFLSALLAAWVLALGAFGFGKRVAISAVLGLFAWMTVALPDWNWYLFPLDYTLGLMAKYLIGWTLAGAAMAWWLGRGESRA